eukprot:TRINITY_DN39800_c0_g1_i1.p1 TRINITY_DN39800_c0_g1~~TRINITY_DN39800_c0_g1_i1.p1  ORF type:complete len:646 (+),score=102.41 TRINITY_DN39800_c0_g1_i1:99-1940(+)
MASTFLQESLASKLEELVRDGRISERDALATQHRWLHDGDLAGANGARAAVSAVGRWPECSIGGLPGLVSVVALYFALGISSLALMRIFQLIVDQIASGAVVKVLCARFKVMTKVLTFGLASIACRGIVAAASDVFGRGWFPDDTAGFGEGIDVYMMLLEAAARTVFSTCIRLERALLWNVILSIGFFSWSHSAPSELLYSIGCRNFVLREVALICLVFAITLSGRGLRKLYEQTRRTHDDHAVVELLSALGVCALRLSPDFEIEDAAEARLIASAFSMKLEVGSDFRTLFASDAERRSFIAASREVVDCGASTVFSVSDVAQAAVGGKSYHTRVVRARMFQNGLPRRCLGHESEEDWHLRPVRLAIARRFTGRGFWVCVQDEGPLRNAFEDDVFGRIDLARFRKHKHVHEFSANDPFPGKTYNCSVPPKRVEGDNEDVDSSGEETDLMSQPSQLFALPVPTLRTVANPDAALPDEYRGRPERRAALLRTLLPLEKERESFETWLQEQAGARASSRFGVPRCFGPVTVSPLAFAGETLSLRGGDGVEDDDAFFSGESPTHCDRCLVIGTSTGDSPRVAAHASEVADGIRAMLEVRRASPLHDDGLLLVSAAKL